MGKIIDYIKETRAEMTHVSWPTRRQAVMFTIIVVVISVLSSLYLGFFDYIFTQIIEKFVL
jgi:preprotein translocase subunit SecE